MTDEDKEKLIILAQQTLHAAYAWNDHNFVDYPEIMARITAESVGIENFRDAKSFIESLQIAYLSEVGYKESRE